MTTPCSSVETTIHQSDNVEVSTPLVEDPQPVADIHGPSHSRLTWEIQNFSHLKQKKLTSEIFGAASYKWQLLVFPKGNNANCLSLYIDVADSPDLPFGWNRYAQFSLAVVNQKEDSLTVRKETRIQLNHRERDWGFKFFMPLDELCEPSRGYLVNDTVVIEADVTVHMMVDIWANDLIKNTGYVGLENQGATCSLNSLLQTLYHIPYFRKAVYQIPTEDDIPSQSVALALQILFFKLQHSDTSVGTEDLTKSFGWNRDDSLIQHDVHELNMKFCANLENKMQGTVVEGTMRKLFEGRFLEYVECTDINFKDLQLDVKGCKDIYASFDKYVKVELLEGYNKYCADHYGLQKAEKGVLFIEFPPVLQLQLKRFEFDCFSSRLVKINDFFEFPLQLDLDRDNGKYLSPEADRSVRNLYTLHSVLVHSGDIHGGHYYAFIRPGLASKWYKFNDGQVTEEYMERNVEVLYGGDDDFSESCSSAYMLLYIREGDKDKIICGIDDNEIPEHLRVSLRKEKENKRRYKAQADLFSINKVARDEDLREPIGKESVFDLVDHDKVPSFRIQKHMPFKHFKTSVSSTSLLACCFEDFVILGADSRIHDNDPTQVLEDNYNKHFLLDGGMHMSVCGWKCTWINIVDWLKQSLPQIQNEDDKKAYTVYCVQYYSCYYVDMTGEPLMPVDAIVGGFWTDPTKLELFHVTRYGHWVDLPVCVGGSGKIFMQDAHSFLKTVPENQILNAMKELLSDAIDNDPGSGGYIQFIMIRSNGEITPITYEPDNFTSPNYYTRV